MSFILDALKKSETERQQQTGAEFSSVPSRSGAGQSFKWLWILGLLLALNVAVLLGILLRPATDEPPPQAPGDEVAQPGAATEPEGPAEPSFADRVATAQQARSERAAAASSPLTPEPAPETTAGRTPPASRPAATMTRVLTIDELRLSGALQMSDLHLDIHVYSEVPADRFVFVNMEKYREGSTLEEGPVVNEITPDGVVLDYRDMTFLLPRE